MSATMQMDHEQRRRQGFWCPSSTAASPMVGPMVSPSKHSVSAKVGAIVPAWRGKLAKYLMHSMLRNDVSAHANAHAELPFGKRNATERLL